MINQAHSFNNKNLILKSKVTVEWRCGVEGGGGWRGGGRRKR